jgi:crotonobetainyl-CoA:carnitine CoA-transferase CaiB-like acyl-CoA transferase
MAILPRQRIPCGPILNLHQVFADPQVLHNRMLLEHHHPRAGHRRLLGLPLKLSEAPPEVRLAAPALGEHTEEILTGLGYSARLIEQFRRDGVL